MIDNITLKEVLELAEKLSTIDKIRLIEHVVPQLERELAGGSDQPPRSLRGLWKGHDTSAAAIGEARAELWASFPRNDV